MSGEKVPTKLIATNPLARKNYFIDEVVEGGIMLQGTEVKSLRDQSPNLRDSYVDVRPGGGTVEAWLMNVHIPPYQHGNIWNHEPSRKRKILLHRHQINRIYGALTKKGLTAVPTRMYFKKGRAKIEIGLGRGKQKSDRRDNVKKRMADREMQRVMKSKKR